jgi:hypothetical protein
MRIGTLVRFTPEHAKYLKELGRKEETGIVLAMTFFTALVAWPSRTTRHFIDLLEEA